MNTCNDNHYLPIYYIELEGELIISGAGVIPVSCVIFIYNEVKIGISFSPAAPKCAKHILMRIMLTLLLDKGARGDPR